jgi:hypothetical protein
MAYTPEQYAGARQWAQGKSAADIFAKGNELGLGLNDYAQIFGASPEQIQSATGFGTAAGLRPDANTWTYGADSSWVRDSAIPQQGGNMGGVRDSAIPQQGGNMGGVRGAAPVNMPQWSNYQGYEANPYLAQQAGAISQNATRALNEQMLPGVRSEAIAAGGFGGSRQGIAEGLAMGRTADAISGAVGNLYSTDYQNQMNRNLQRYQTDVGSALGLGQLDATIRGIDNQYALGLGGLNMQQRGLDNQYALGLGGLNMQQRGLDNQLYLGQGGLNMQGRGLDNQYDLGLKGLDQSRYQTDKSYEVGMANANASAANAAANQATAAGQLGLAQDRFGFESALMLQDRLMGYNNLGLSAAGQIHNTPMNYWNQFSQGANSLGQGYGTTTQSGGGNPLMGAIGGAQLGSQAANWWNSQNATSSPGTAWYSVNQGMGD